MANPIVYPRFKSWLPDGITPNAGGFLYFYAAGTSTPQAVYTDPNLTVAAANPVSLDSNGECFVYGLGLQYKLVCQDSLGSQIWSADFISIGTGSSGSGGGSVITSEWVLSALTPLFINATSFFLGGDQTGTFPIGRRIKTTNTSNTIYSTVVGSVFATGNTTITVKNDFGSLDSGLSTVSYGLLNSLNTSSPLQSYVSARYVAISALTSTIAQALFLAANGTVTVAQDQLGEFVAATGLFTPFSAGTYSVTLEGNFTGSGTFTVTPPAFQIFKTGGVLQAPVGYGTPTTLGTVQYPSFPVTAAVTLTLGQAINFSALATFTGTMSVGTVNLTIRRIA
jgi:hypothetical protein